MKNYNKFNKNKKKHEYVKIKPINSFFFDNSDKKRNNAKITSNFVVKFHSEQRIIIENLNIHMWGILPIIVKFFAGLIKNANISFLNNIFL